MDYQKEFQKMITSISDSKGIAKVFDDWAEAIACSLHQLPYHSEQLSKDDDFNKIEDQYMKAIKGYNKEELEIFAKLMSIATAALAEKKQDFLGKIYMDLEIGNKNCGQFFTPYHVSQAMAQITIYPDDLEKIIKEKGFITICEPASGAGSMLIAAAETLETQGFNPMVNMIFEATDISRLCFNMTYIQTSLCGLAGTVIQGDSLTLEVSEIRKTYQLKLLEDHYKHDIAIEKMRQLFKKFEVSNTLPTQINYKEEANGQLSFDF